MPKDLFSDSEAEKENLQRERDLRGELSLIQEELELYSHPAWSMYSDRLESMVVKDMDALVSCAIEEVAPIRARIKHTRHLLGLERELQGKAADLRLKIQGPEDEDA